MESTGYGHAAYDSAVLGSRRPHATPALSPAELDEIQLTALQANEESDAGIAQTCAFAHPDNKRMTGPLRRFAQMIKGPLYRMLLDTTRTS